jgi:hypothetical protein
MAEVTEIMDALATRIETVLCGTANPLIEHLQVDGRLIPSPTTPAIDIYPGDPFTEPLGFGPGNKELFFTVRARVSTADNEGGQNLLLSMMDPNADTSLEQAILDGDRTLGGVVGAVASVEGPSAYGIFADPGQTTQNLLGCLWRVRVIQ